MHLANERFGSDGRKIAFRCPNCEDVATTQDFLDVGSHAYGQECIGRSLGALDKDYNGRGCNWTAYGLFKGPWLVTLPDGSEIGCFPLAEVEEVLHA